MTHPFEIELETTLPATPEQVWDAIATGPGVDSWFMGRNEIEAGEGGTAAMDTGGYREEAVVTAYDPGKRLATRTAPGPTAASWPSSTCSRAGRAAVPCCASSTAACSGTTGRTSTTPCAAAGPSTSTRCASTWRTFPARTAVPVFGMAPTGDRSSQDVQALLAGALSLTAPVTTGSRVDGGPRPHPWWTAKWSGPTANASASAAQMRSIPSTTARAWR